MIVLAALLAVTVAAVVFLVWRQSTASLVASKRARRVIVTLKTGDSFGALLYAVDREAVVLREAQALAYGPRSEHVAVEGEVLILRGDIAYLQFP